MKRVLLILSTTRYAKASLDGALSEAASIASVDGSAGLHILYIRETEELARVKSSVDDRAFLGMSPQDHILESLEKQHHATAMRRLERAKRGASTLDGVVFSAEEIQGDYAELAGEAAVDFDVVYLCRADRPFVSRLLFGSDTDTVARLVRSEGGKVIVNDAMPPAWQE
ncbi:MAG TPA: hypothetical protein QGF58_26135 [Myxococcota bacterium]|nr:hypothetical protein [Myxococcota bacterium]